MLDPEPTNLTHVSSILCTEESSEVLLLPSREVRSEPGNDRSVIAQFKLYRFPLITLAVLALVFGVAIPVAANISSSHKSDQSESFLSGRTNLVSKKLARAFQKCAGKAVDKDAESYIGCEIGCICEEVNQYYSQCAPPGEESECSKKGAMPTVLALKKKYEVAKEAAKKARSTKLRFRKEADKAIGAAKWFKKEMFKAEGTANWWKKEAAKAAYAGGFGDVTADNVLAKAQYIIDEANKASGKAKYLRDKANSAAEKAKGIYPPTNCAKAFGQCNDGPKCCQEGCVCTPKEAHYSQCQIPSGFDSCNAAAASSAKAVAATSNAKASEAERIADSKQKAAQAAKSVQDNQNKADKAVQKSKEMDVAAAKAEAKAKRTRIASEKAAKIVVPLRKNAKKWLDAVKEFEDRSKDPKQGNDKDKADEEDVDQQDKEKDSYENDDDNRDEKGKKNDDKEKERDNIDEHEKNGNKEDQDKTGEEEDKITLVL